MKRKISLFIGLFAIALLSLNSCKKNEVVPTSMELDMSKTATITGLVKAQLSAALDINGTDKIESAPEGTKLIVKVALNQYNNNAPEGKFITFQTEVGSAGRYSIDVPANENGVDISIEGVEFEYNFEAYSLVDTNWVKIEPELRYYSTDKQEFSILAGSNYEKSFEFTGTEL